MTDMKEKIDSVLNSIGSVAPLTSSPTTKVTDTPAVAQVSKVIAAANPNRKGFLIYNNGANSCYITYGASANSAACTRILATFASFESIGAVCYTGPISAIRNAGTGNIIVTELL